MKGVDSMQIGLPVNTDSWHTRDWSMGPFIIVLENSRLEASIAGLDRPLDRPLDHAQSDSPARPICSTLQAPFGTSSAEDLSHRYILPYVPS